MSGPILSVRVAHPIEDTAPAKPAKHELTLGQVIGLLGIMGASTAEHAPLARAFSQQLRAATRFRVAPSAEDFCTLTSLGLIAIVARRYRLTLRGLGTASELLHGRT